MSAQYIPSLPMQTTGGDRPFGQPPALPYDQAQANTEYPLRVPTQTGACHPIPLGAIESLNAIRSDSEEQARKAAEALVCMRRSFDACRLYELLTDLGVIL